MYDVETGFFHCEFLINLVISIDCHIMYLYNFDSLVYVSVVSRYIQKMALWQQQPSRASDMTRLRAGLGQGRGEGQEQRCP